MISNQHFFVEFILLLNSTGYSNNCPIITSLAIAMVGILTNLPLFLPPNSMVCVHTNYLLFLPPNPMVCVLTNYLLFLPPNPMVCVLTNHPENNLPKIGYYISCP